MTEENGTMTESELLFALLRSAICGTEESDCNLPLMGTTIETLYNISRAHDIAHLVSSALQKKEMLGADEVSQKFQKKQLLAVYRSEQMKYALGQICSVFEKEEIPYIPLKGAVLRFYYPEEWMRTSCDIDILIHEKDMDRAVNALVDTLGYKTDHKVNYHDVSLYSQTGIHLELHFSLKERMENIDGLLSEVWEYSVRANENGFRFNLSNEYFLFHHVAHMSYHFVHGGCGIKPFIDLYIIKNKIGYDDSIVTEYLKRCEIETFYRNILYVTDVWFGENTHTELSRQIEHYILKGGVYGTLENKIVVQQSKTGSKAKYVISRLFIPYDTLKIIYPILKKHKFLFPFMQIRRWIGLLFGGKMKRGVQELKLSQNTSKSQVSSMNEFLENIGL